MSGVHDKTVDDFSYNRFKCRHMWSSFMQIGIQILVKKNLHFKNTVLAPATPSFSISMLSFPRALFPPASFFEKHSYWKCHNVRQR